MRKREVLQTTTFGQRVAEDEGNELSAYFVETDQWQRIFAGEIDIVYGPKGSGKSAIYSLLIGREDELFDRGILLVPAERPRGAPVFENIAESDPATSEAEFRNLWKLYFLLLIANRFREYDIQTDAAKRVTVYLEDEGLLPKEFSLQTVVRTALDYVARWFKPQAGEVRVHLDPNTGTPLGVTGKITLTEPNMEQRKQGALSVDRLLELSEMALEESGTQVWLTLDRLDVAFAESEELERNALRALFRVYRDIAQFGHIALKIFLRNDIWQRITNEGFRESSHITRDITISWDRQSLMNLIVRRALHSPNLRDFYGVDEGSTLADFDKQRELFYRVFPPQVDLGGNKPETFDWMLSRTRDGTGITAPRELIHLLSSTRDVQLQRLDVGSGNVQDEALFDRLSLKEALPEVSRVRLDQTLCAEYPDLKPWIMELERAKTQQTLSTLSEIWGCNGEKAQEVASNLVEVGFFERREGKENLVYWVPFLYRDALQMVQGAAE